MLLGQDVNIIVRDKPCDDRPKAHISVVTAAVFWTERKSHKFNMIGYMSGCGLTLIYRVTIYIAAIPTDKSELKATGY